MVERILSGFVPGVSRRPALALAVLLQQRVQGASEPDSVTQKYGTIRATARRAEPQVIDRAGYIYRDVELTVYSIREYDQPNILRASFRLIWAVEPLITIHRLRLLMSGSISRLEWVDLDGHITYQMTRIHASSIASRV
jgi:hypothetical protein